MNMPFDKKMIYIMTYRYNKEEFSVNLIDKDIANNSLIRVINIVIIGIVIRYMCMLMV